MGFITRDPRVINPIQARDRHGITIFYSPSVATIGFPGTVVKAAFCLGKDLSEWCSCEVCQQMREVSTSLVSSL